MVWVGKYIHIWAFVWRHKRNKYRHEYSIFGDLLQNDKKITDWVIFCKLKLHKVNGHNLNTRGERGII